MKSVESVFNKTTEQPRDGFLTNTDSTDNTDVRKGFLLITIRKIRVIRVQIKTQITKEMFLTNTDSTDYTDVRKKFSLNNYP